MSSQLSIAFIPFTADLQSRIANARASELSLCARAVLDILASETGPHLGADSAISISAMQRIWESRGAHVWNERSVKAAAKELIESAEIPVGSSRSSDRPGYFLCASAEDFETSERPLRGELISIARRLRVFNPKSQFARQVLGRLGLEGQ